jgi:hypothetical protein
VTVYIHHDWSARSCDYDVALFGRGLGHVRDIIQILQSVLSVGVAGKPGASLLVTRRSLKKEAWVRSQVSPCRIHGGQNGIGTGFHQVLLFSAVSITAAMLHSNLRLDFAVTRRTKGRGLGTIRKSMRFRKSGALDKKVLILTEEFQLTFAVIFFGENLPSLVC